MPNNLGYGEIMTNIQERSIVVSKFDNAVCLGYGFQDGVKNIPSCATCGNRCEHDDHDRTYAAYIFGVTCLFVFCSDKCKDEFMGRKNSETFFESNIVLELMSNALESIYEEWKETRDAKIKPGLWTRTTTHH